jgi:hypothetical protein
VIARFCERYTPHALAASLCAGLASACLIRSPSNGVLGVAVVAAVLSAVALERYARTAALALALGAGGLWWGSGRLDALDRSVLVPRIGEAGRGLVEITGPARRTRYRIRIPARMRSFRSLGVRESVLLELPPGRAPPNSPLSRRRTRSSPAPGASRGRWFTCW